MEEPWKISEENFTSTIMRIGPVRGAHITLPSPRSSSPVHGETDTADNPNNNNDASRSPPIRGVSLTQ